MAAAAVALLSTVTVDLAGQATSQSQTGPVISDYGPVFDVPNTDFATPTDHMYRVAFDVSAAPESPDAVNRRIVTVARFLNMHANAGVPTDKMEVALVLHGGSGKYALANDAYRARYDTDNPNLGLITALHGQGVRIILCGQTAASRGFPKHELAEPVELALSAMTALIVLQSEGYGLIQF